MEENPDRQRRQPLHPTRRGPRHVPALVLALLLPALPLSGAAGQEDGSADGPGENCSTRAEIAGRSAGAVTVGEPNEGFHGIRYGGTPVMDDDGPPHWARPPVVRDVHCSSPADSAGIVPGDTILAVNGKDARRARVLTPYEPGMDFRLLILREGEVLTFDLTTVRRPR